jgi:cytochrome c oxidase subunit 2
MGATRARRWLIGMPAAACLAMTGCAEQPATSQAQEVHTLYYVILALAAAVFIGVEGTLLWSIVRYRRRKGDQSEPPQREGTTRMVMVFFSIGAVLVAILFPFGEITLARVQSNPPPVETINIQGSQWQWSAVYPNEGVATSGKSFVRPLVIEVPVGEPVHIHLISNDVMHELFVPAFFFMRNAMPGLANDFTWTPTRLGTFNGQCAEFCGLGHSKMTFVVRVVTETDFLAWVKKERQALLSITCPAKSGNQVHVTAKDISWNTNCLAVPEGQPISLTVTNLDGGIDHNFAIWDGIDMKHQFFATGKFPGVATHGFTIQALPVGKYFFECNVHGPAMSGVFIVGHPKHAGG